MLVGGLVPLTTIDYPEKMASVIFTQGCPWRCGFCHNSHLQGFKVKPEHEWPNILEFLKERAGFLEAVVFSGGEATVQQDLRECMLQVKDMGYLIGLHTAGVAPHRLEKIVDIVDWVGLDIKAPIEKYPEITKVAESGVHAYESLQILVDYEKDFEVRTTVCQRFLNEEDILDIAEMIHDIGAKYYVLQQYRPIFEEEGFVPIRSFISDDVLCRLKTMFCGFMIRE